MGDAHRIGIVGLGSISAAYLTTLADSPAVVITAVADLDAARASTVASGLPAARALTVADLLASDEVDTVLNLTIPAAHAEIAHGAIAHGKDVYGEKPLAVTMAEAREIMAAASRAGVRVGSAPDTVLGTGTQTARAAIDAGPDRPSDRRECRHDHARPRVVASESGLLLPARRRAAARHGSVLRLRAHPAARSGAVGRRRVEPARGRSASSRSGARNGGAHPRRGADARERRASSTSAARSRPSRRASTAWRRLRRRSRCTARRAPSPCLIPNTFDGEVRLVARALTRSGGRCPVAAGYVDAARGAGLLDFIAAGPDHGPGRASGAVALHASTS